MPISKFVNLFTNIQEMDVVQFYYTYKILLMVLSPKEDILDINLDRVRQYCDYNGYE